MLIIGIARYAYTYITQKQGVMYVHKNIEQRACELAEYIIENKATVRAAAKQFGISKSTVHKDLTERLKTVSPSLYREVRRLLDINKAERHIRGGMATKRKYELSNKTR